MFVWLKVFILHSNCFSSYFLHIYLDILLSRRFIWLFLLYHGFGLQYDHSAILT